MTAVDFSAWVIPDLELTLGERTYLVPPPSVERAKMILAAAVRGEVNLGIVPGPVPDEVNAVLETIGDSHPGLTDAVHQQMVADDVDVTTIDRLSVFSVFHWARGADYAGAIAMLLWGPRETAVAEGGDGDAPKD